MSTMKRLLHRIEHNDKPNDAFAELCEQHFSQMLPQPISALLSNLIVRFPSVREAAGQRLLRGERNKDVIVLVLPYLVGQLRINAGRSLLTRDREFENGSPFVERLVAVMQYVPELRDEAWELVKANYLHLGHLCDIIEFVDSLPHKEEAARVLLGTTRDEGDKLYVINWVPSLEAEVIAMPPIAA